MKFDFSLTKDEYSKIVRENLQKTNTINCFAFIFTFVMIVIHIAFVIANEFHPISLFLLLVSCIFTLNSIIITIYDFFFRNKIINNKNATCNQNIKIEKDKASLILQDDGEKKVFNFKIDRIEILPTAFVVYKDFDNFFFIPKNKVVNEEMSRLIDKYNL